jgi:hypothetical protein
MECGRDSKFCGGTCQVYEKREELKKTFNEIERHKSRKIARGRAIILANGNRPRGQRVPRTRSHVGFRSNAGPY